MRFPQTLFIALALGCSEEPEVVVGNANLPPGSKLEACVNGACPGGLECVENVCRPPLVDPTPIGGDTGGTDGTVAEPDVVETSDTPGDDTTGVVDDTGGSDGGSDVVVAVPDTEVPDTAGPIDTGNEPDVAPLPDACDAPGQPSTCPTTPTFLYCRYEPSVKSLQCSAPTDPFATGKYGTPCSGNKDCDYSLGCHFGICTTYCELALQACAFPGAKCTTIGSPKWGACQPPE
jgi:hypothetical protein